MDLTELRASLASETSLRYEDQNSQEDSIWLRTHGGHRKKTTRKRTLTTGEVRDTGDATCGTGMDHKVRMVMVKYYGLVTATNIPYAMP